MRLIIAGSRGFDNYAALCRAVFVYGLRPSVIISGTARGADQLGEMFAACHGVPVERFPADWNRHGKRADYLRNAEMANNADALPAFWDGESRGTRHMIDLAEKAGLAVYVWRF